MSDEPLEVPGNGGSYLRDKTGRLRLREEPTVMPDTPPAEPTGTPDITPTPEKEA